MSTGPYIVTGRFKPRVASGGGVRTWDEWRIKVYDILAGDVAYRRSAFDAGLEQAVLTLPHPAVTRQRPGAGFAIAHQGRGIDYIVLCWWDNENELFTRVFVHVPTQADDRWRPAFGGEAGCVWDLEIVDFERRAFIETVLTRDRPSVEAYLAAQFRAPQITPEQAAETSRSDMPVLVATHSDAEHVLQALLDAEAEPLPLKRRAGRAAARFAFESVLQPLDGGGGLALPAGLHKTCEVGTNLALTVNGHAFRTRVVEREGRLWIPVNRINVTAAGAELGETVSATVELD